MTDLIIVPYSSSFGHPVEPSPNDFGMLEIAVKDPKNYLKRVWQRIEEGNFSREEKKLGLFTVAFALITIIHGETV